MIIIIKLIKIQVIIICIHCQFTIIVNIIVIINFKQ